MKYGAQEMQKLIIVNVFNRLYYLDFIDVTSDLCDTLCVTFSYFLSGLNCPSWVLKKSHFKKGVKGLYVVVIEAN